MFKRTRRKGATAFWKFNHLREGERMTRFNARGTNVQPDIDDEEHFDPIENLLGRLRRQRSKRPRPLARVLEASAVNQPALASAYIEKRRQGLWGKNRNDQAAFDSAKWIEDLARIIAEVPTNTARIGVHSFNVATAADERMKGQIDALPEELQEDAQTLAYYISEVIAATGLEATKMYPEIANKVIAELYNNKNLR
jgi:hypothetical protein